MPENNPSPDAPKDEITRILQDTIEVRHEGECYEFRIPSLADDIKMGIVERNIRRDIERELGAMGLGDAEGVDNATYLKIQAAATFQLLLKSCTSEWPYTTGADGKPAVDYTKWPKDKVGAALNVTVLFQQEVARFRYPGPADGRAAG